MSERSQRIASRIQDEHDRLQKLIGEIREELSCTVEPDGFPDWKLEFVWKIRDFQNELTKHFDLEEDGGFMEDVVEQAPRFSDQVKALEQEHVDAVKQLDDITTELKHLTVFEESLLREICGKIMNLFEMLERHEALERELILEVYFQDIGVGD
jgi:hemerythrin-like domain-containing protein